MALLEDEHLQPGDWVLIHVGFAMSKIDRRSEPGLSLVASSWARPMATKWKLSGHPMRFVDEFATRPPPRGLGVAQITSLAGDDHFKFMEVCGGHTHTIYRHGIEHVLPPSVELVHGPGCPVCVIPMGRVDDAISVAKEPACYFHLLW